MTDIRLIVFDVDGTLTCGNVLLDADGSEMKEFDVADGLAFRLADAAGIHLGVISARSSKAVQQRMSWLPPENVRLSVGDKASALRSMQERLGVSVMQTAFVGDDLNDLPAFARSGLRIAPSNAAVDVKREANYITAKGGGRGAGREAIEWILRRQNSYRAAVNKYLERELSNV